MQSQRAQGSTVPVAHLIGDQEFICGSTSTTASLQTVEHSKEAPHALFSDNHGMSQIPEDLWRQELGVQSPRLESHPVAARHELVFGKKYHKCGVTGQITEYTHVVTSGPYSGDTKNPYTNIATYLATGLTKQSDPEVYCRHEQDLNHFIVHQWYRADRTTGRMILVKKEEIPVASVAIPSRIQYREAGYNLEDHPKTFWKYCPNPMYSKYYHH